MKRSENQQKQINKKEHKNGKNKLLMEDDPAEESGKMEDGGGLVRLVTARPGQR